MRIKDLYSTRHVTSPMQPILGRGVSQGTMRRVRPSEKNSPQRPRRANADWADRRSHEAFGTAIDRDVVSLARAAKSPVPAFDDQHRYSVNALNSFAMAMAWQGEGSTPPDPLSRIPQNRRCTRTRALCCHMLRAAPWRIPRTDRFPKGPGTIRVRAPPAGSPFTLNCKGIC